ncbi:CFA20 protein, partial [Acromyrmex heyeri]
MTKSVLNTPVLISLIVKNLNLWFKLEVQYLNNDSLLLIHMKIIDKQQYRRRFSFMTYNVGKLPSINASIACIPLRLDDCWNFLEINFQTLCHQVYKTDYEALQRVTIYQNCHLRRVYLQNRHYNDDELYQTFFNMYMLKQGITFIEKSCQTGDCYTGKNNSMTPKFKVDAMGFSSSFKADDKSTASRLRSLVSIEEDAENLNENVRTGRNDKACI